MRANKQVQSTNWIFTLNNPTEEESDALAILYDIDHPFEKSSSKVTAVAASLETGKNGTPHFQGYLQLSKKGIFLFYRARSSMVECSTFIRGRVG